MKNDKKQVWNAIVMVFQFSIYMLVPIFALTFLGIYIGNKTGIDWICIPLFFIGAIAGFNNIFRVVKKMIKDDEKGRRHD